MISYVSEPSFRYHPDPIASGSAVREDHVCSVCGLAREVRYHGPVYGAQPTSLCLHCIHSGQASLTLGITARSVDGTDYLDTPADFSDSADVPDDVPMAIVEEITRRTPGFTGWQDPYWLYHCADGTAFLGPAGYNDLEQHPDALEMIREDLRQLRWPADESERFLRRMDRIGEPTAYLFRCLHCGVHLASWDFT